MVGLASATRAPHDHAARTDLFRRLELVLILRTGRNAGRNQPASLAPNVNGSSAPLPAPP